MVVIFRTPWRWIHSIILVVIRLFVISLFELVVLMYSNYEPWNKRQENIISKIHFLSICSWRAVASNMTS